MRRILTHVPLSGHFIGGSKRNYVFGPKDYITLCDNERGRYAENPQTAAYFLVRKDFRHVDSLEVSEFPFAQLHTGVHTQSRLPFIDQQIKIPKILPIFDLQADYDVAKSEPVLYGENQIGEKLVGKPLCEITFQPKVGVSETYDYYSMKPAHFFHNTQQKIEKFSNTLEADFFKKKKESNTKKSEPLDVINPDISFRADLKTRKPDQNQVMGYQAVKEYQKACVKYNTALSQDLYHILYHAGNVNHSSTLLAKKAKGEFVSGETEYAAHRDRLLRPEWLHRHSFVLHPRNLDPQIKENLGAARACDNTRMMLLERVLKWFGLKEEMSKNSLYGEFDLFLDTEIIEKITLFASCVLHGNRFQLKQEIDTLVKNPEMISASDLAGLVTLLSFMMQSRLPEKIHTLEIKSRFTQENFFQKSGGKSDRKELQLDDGLSFFPS